LNSSAWPSYATGHLLKQRLADLAKVKQFAAAAAEQTTLDVRLGHRDLLVIPHFGAITVPMADALRPD